MKKKEVYIILFLSILLGLLTSCSNAMSLTTTAEYSTIALINTATEEKEQEETSAPHTLTESESHQSEKVPETIEPTSSTETEEMRTILETYQNYVDEYAPVESGYTYELIYIDEDDIPELFVESDAEAGGNLLITYHESMLYVAEIDRLFGFQYVEKANFYKNSNGHMGYYYDIFYTLIDGYQTVLEKGHWGDKWKDGEVVWDDEADYPMQEYFWNEEECGSKEEYEEAITTFCESVVENAEWKKAGVTGNGGYLDVYAAYEALRK